MAAVTSFFTLDYVARILDENVELLEAIVSNDDNLIYAPSSASTPVRTRPSPR